MHPQALIDPQLELVFSPDSRVTSTSLTITNPHDRYVAYKILFNSKKKFVAQPPVGVIRPNSIKTIPISVKPNNIDDDDVCRVMTAFCEKDVPSDFWSTIARSSTSTVDLRVILGGHLDSTSSTKPNVDVHQLYHNVSVLKHDCDNAMKQADTYRRWAGSLILALLLLVLLMAMFYNTSFYTGIASSDL
eukprot:GDKJ01032340.1.p1 GENE.GDKJ01032340.1~~GDKJ01032340.1.p1  ORF type:complete len:189 (-),score=40.62 GDKJ01032340.1:71-637(-)